MAMDNSLVKAKWEEAGVGEGGQTGTPAIMSTLKKSVNQMNI